MMMIFINLNPKILMIMIFLHAFLVHYLYGAYLLMFFYNHSSVVQLKY